MWQIGFSLSSNHSKPNIFVDAFRVFFGLIDWGVYSLVTVVYKILFNIADTTIFSSNTIKDFYGRVQLIIGVFMIFKLSISLLQAVINPDYLTDQKKGMGKIITRIVMMLAMFAAIIPLNIPLTQTEIENAKSSNNVKSFNYHLNQSGLLFGVMYSLQERILKGNVLGKLVFSNDTERYKISEDQDDDEDPIINQANDLAVFILKGFVRINLKDGAADKGTITDDDYICSPNYSDDEQEKIAAYNNGKDIYDIVGTDVIYEQCGDGPMNGKPYYLVTYLPIVSTICGILILLVLISYCIDIAIRAIKLAILRLLAPIPIISYVDPKSSENGSFAAWTKALISTYVDLFIRLAIIYFVIFLVQEICENGLDIPIANGVVGIISTIFIIIGLFYFAKMAPKFIRDALGLKGMMSNVGLSGLLGATGSLVGGAGLKGAIAGGLNASENSAMASAQGKEAPPAWSTGRDLAAQIRTGNEKAKGGIVNRLNDNLTRGAMIRQAGKRYGVTHAGLEEAKGNMYEQENELFRKQGDLEKLRNGQMTDEELNNIFGGQEYKNMGYTTGKDSSGKFYIKDKDGNKLSKFDIQDQLYKRYEDQKKTYGKAKNHYEEAAKFAEQHRIEPTFEEQYRRPFMAKRNKVNYGTDHQSMADRVLGRGQIVYDNEGNVIRDRNDHPVRDRKRDNSWDPLNPGKFD